MTNYIEYLENPQHIHDYKQALGLIKKFESNTTLANGVMRWKSNDRVIPADCAELAKHVGYFVDLDSMNEIRNAEMETFLAGYIEAQKNRTDDQLAEERYEMRAAFGPGATVTNVITGKTVAL